MRANRRKLVALFLIMLVVSTSVAALGFSGSQNGVGIDSPTGYDAADASTYYIVDGNPAQIAQVCTSFGPGCSAECGSRHNYLDLYLLKGVDPTASNYRGRDIDEAYLQDIVNNPGNYPDVSLEFANDFDGGSGDNAVCFSNVQIYYPGYYLIRIGAFGSPEKGGSSNGFATGFVRVLEKDTRACLNDGVVVQAGQPADRHQYLCNADHTYQRCKLDGTDYEETGFCKQECGALTGCTDLKPNPDCVDSCISEGGTYKIVADSTGSIRVNIPLPDNGQAVVEVNNQGVITNTEVNNVPATSQNVDANTLIGNIQQNSVQTVDTTIPKNTILQDPATEAVQNEFNIESFEIGNGEFTPDGTAVNGYTPFQRISLNTTVNGTLGATVSIVLYFIKVEGTGDNQLEGDRNLMLTKLLKLDTPEGDLGKATVPGEKFFAVLPDGIYKPMLELYQDKELRQVSYWMQNGQPGVIAIAFDPAKFKQKIEGDMGSLATPPSPALEGLFNDFLTARKDALANNNWPDAALPAFRTFMDQYLHWLYPDQADYDRAKALLMGDDQKLKDTMLQFVDQVVAPAETDVKNAADEAKRMAYDNYLSDGIYNTEEISQKAYQVRIDSFTKPWYKVVGDYALMVISFDIINLVRSIVKAAYTAHDKAIIEFKQEQINETGGSFSESRNVNSNKMLFSEFYPKMTDIQATNNDQINSILGVQLGAEDIDKLRKPFYDYVLTRDQMKSISDDNPAGAAYGWGWMYYYSGLTAFKGDPSSYTDYPLKLHDGGSVTRETYSSTPKAEHDSIPGPGNVWTAIANSEADVVMYETLYTAALNYFESVKTDYADSADYVALANDRINDIKTIRTTQNVVKGLELVVGFVLSIVVGSFAAKGIGALIKGAVEGTSLLTKVGGKVPGAFNLLLNLARGAGYAVIGLNAWKIYNNCYKYYSTRGSLSEAERIMDSGQWIERCVDPALRIGVSVVSLGALERNVQQSGIQDNEDFKLKTRGGRFANWLLSRVGTGSAKILPKWPLFGFSKAVPATTSEVGNILPGILEYPGTSESNEIVVNAETLRQLEEGASKAQRWYDLGSTAYIDDLH